MIFIKTRSANFTTRIFSAALTVFIMWTSVPTSLDVLVAIYRVAGSLCRLSIPTKENSPQTLLVVRQYNVTLQLNRNEHERLVTDAQWSLVSWAIMYCLEANLWKSLLLRNNVVFSLELELAETNLASGFHCTKSVQSQNHIFIHNTYYEYKLILSN